jgi:fatty acid desaturase
MNAVPTAPTPAMNDAEFLRRVNRLRETDNWRSWLYLAREWAFLAAVLAPAIVLFELVRLGQIPWWTAILPTVVAILCVGAGQHRLATLTHEAAHYMLFRNRLLNEIVSEWFCMFPILGQTHPYRVQHLGHHQYPNDPERDPDWAQMLRSGHRYTFPMTRGRFLWECFLKQLLWPPALIRYVLVRASYLVDQKGGPYSMKRRTAPGLRFGALGYYAALAGSLVAGVLTGSAVWLGVVPIALFVGVMIVYSLVPESWLASFTIQSDLPVRWQNCMRLTFNSLLLAGLAWLAHATGSPCWLYFFLLWLVPLGSSFALFMILRQIVQHGNADRERFTNTRVFEVHPLLSLSIFPIGNDYHLPHHLFPLVPHYNLRKLHELLMEIDDYRRSAVLVRGYFFSPERPQEHPTVVDTMTR